VFSYPVPRSGVAYSPAFEAREAARWAHYTWQQFCRLDGEDQSTTVAHYRVSQTIEAVVAADAARRARQKQPKG